MDAGILTQQSGAKYQNAKIKVAHSDIQKNADMKSADTKQSACIIIVCNDKANATVHLNESIDDKVLSLTAKIECLKAEMDIKI